MSSLARRLSVLIALALGLAVLAGCGGGGGDSGDGGEGGESGGELEEASGRVATQITRTVTTFHKSFSAGDGGNTCATLTSSAERNLVKGVRGATDCTDAISRLEKARNKAKVPPIKVTAVKANAKQAEAELADAEPVKLTRQDGEWRISDVGGALNQPMAAAQ